MYPVRAALRFLGTVLDVAGAVLTQDPDYGVDTTGAVLLRSPDGVAAHLTFGMDNAYRSTYELRGSGGELSLDRAFTPRPDHRPVVRLRPQGGAEREIPLEPDDQVANTLAAFASAVRAGAAPTAEVMAQARLLDSVRHLAG